MPVSADSLLPPTWRQEDFSIAYACAVAAACGVAWDIPRRDMNSCDVRFYARDDEHDDGPQLNAQLKCTASGLTTSQEHPGTWRFQLKASNFNHLRKTPTHPPRILVVVRCPINVDDWVRISDEELLMSAEAWWVNLSGQDALSQDQETVTVSIPTAQRFDPAALSANMCSCP